MRLVTHDYISAGMPGARCPACGTSTNYYPKVAFGHWLPFFNQEQAARSIVSATKSDRKMRVVVYTGAYVRRGATSSLGRARGCVIDLFRPEADISSQYIWHERRRLLGGKCEKNLCSAGVEPLSGGQ